MFCHSFMEGLFSFPNVVFCIPPGTVWHRQHCSVCVLVFCPWGGPVSVCGLEFELDRDVMFLEDSPDVTNQ